MAIILEMRERMEEMQRQMQEFVNFVKKEMLSHPMADPGRGAIVPIQRVVPPAAAAGKEKKKGH
jgi:MerR family transcriptional regulator/heat shock protein HspR